MVQKCAIFLISFLVIATSCALADDGGMKAVPIPVEKPYLIPQSRDNFRAINKAAVEHMNDVEDWSTNKDNIEYDEKGRIVSMGFEDGSTMECAYEGGNVANITFRDKDGNEVIIRRAYDDNEDDDTAMTNFLNDLYKFRKEKEEKKIVPVIVTVYLPQPLEPFVQNPKPFKFDEIKDQIRKITEEREAIMDEYLKKSDSYYKSIIKQLKEKRLAFKKEGIDFNEDIVCRELEPSKLINGKDRGAIDDTVRYIRKQSEESAIPRITADYFLVSERLFYNKYMRTARGIYEHKMARTIAYLNEVIEGIIKSNLAIYLRATTETIDAVVQLPQE